MVSEENKDNQMNKDRDRPSIRKNENETTRRFSSKNFEEKRAVDRTNEQTIVRRKKSAENKKAKPEILPNANREATAKKEEKPEAVSKRRQAKQAKKEAKKEKKLSKGRIRYIPVWLRVILIALLCIGAFIGGLMIGFGSLGEGDDMRSVLDREFWDSLLEYIRGE